MSLKSFLHKLHYDPDHSRPPDFEPDWSDAPLAYKLYRGLPTFPLSSEVPLTLEGRAVPDKADIRDIGHFLWYAYGLAQLCQSVFHMDPGEQEASVFHTLRRFAPSGGALYPSELYVYLKTDDLPDGIYHYDAAHHRLVLLRLGDFDAYLARGLGDRCDLSVCFGAVFVSTVFWKNFFKYNNFSYRLQGLDAGALIGQLLETAKRFGYHTGVYFRFLDRAVNHLLGLDEQGESVYAVIPLSLQPGGWFYGSGAEAGVLTSRQLCAALPPIRHEHYVRSLRLIEFPMLLRMNEASLMETSASFGPLDAADIGGTMTGEGETVALPRMQRLPYDLASIVRKRYSPHLDFVSSTVDAHQVAALLHEATASFPYMNDLDPAGHEPRKRVSIYGCLYGIDGIPDGAYRYDALAHELRLIRPGDYRMLLQQGIAIGNVNLFQTPLCLHVAADRNHYADALGFRGYRIQQMEAGMLVQRLLIAGVALGLNGHPLLSFNPADCDKIYRMEAEGVSSLIQVPLGACRPSSRLEGGLYS
ncbi:SagB family peptide dehydrogenase [Paenibacillus elgii]|uniref:SagB family peptide dehydrogenase n=1 Tax=Paenibacillus elgii TaxID=189691 RepID=UPI002D7C8282|nr:SagB family peptide dehydrogenase [Paenibacillus elgii]